MLRDEDREDFFTMVIPSYEKRADLLKNLLDYLSVNQSSHQYETVIVWGSPKEKMIPIDKYKYPIRVFFPEKSSVVSRFTPKINTRCFFSLDDDIRIEPYYIDKFFHVWKNNTDQLVGYFQRSYKKINNTKVKYITPKKNRPYKLILTGIGLFDQKYARAIYSEKYSESLKYCYSINNCEDLLLNFIIAELSKKPPIKVDAKIKYIEHNAAISKISNHYKIRGKCIARFLNYFGDVLILTKNVVKN